MPSSQSAKAFTLIEIMIVVAIIGIIVAVAVPAFLRAREVSRSRGCQENLSKIDAAVDMYAIDNKLNSGDDVSLPDLVKAAGTGYLRAVPSCPAGGTYTEALKVGTAPTCSIGVNTNADFAPHAL